MKVNFGDKIFFKVVQLISLAFNTYQGKLSRINKDVRIIFKFN